MIPASARSFLTAFTLQTKFGLNVVRCTVHRHKGWCIVTALLPQQEVKIAVQPSTPIAETAAQLATAIELEQAQMELPFNRGGAS